jgi:hypothetical protein
MAQRYATSVPYIILRLEHNTHERRIRDLLFTETQWERFLDALPGLEGFLGFAPIINGPTATFIVDMDQPGLPNSDSRALESAHLAVLAYWTERTLATSGIFGIDIGGEDGHVSDSVAEKIATHLAISEIQPWTHFLGASGWMDRWISEHANENVRGNENLVKFLRRRSEAIHNTIYATPPVSEGPGYPEAMQVLGTAPSLVHPEAEPRAYRSIFEYLKDVEDNHPPNIFKIILLNGLGLPTIDPLVTPGWEKTNQNLLAPRSLPPHRGRGAYKQYLEVWNAYAAEYSSLDLTAMVGSCLNGIYGASEYSGVRRSWEHAKPSLPAKIPFEDPRAFGELIVRMKHNALDHHGNPCPITDASGPVYPNASRYEYMEKTVILFEFYQALRWRGVKRKPKPPLAL